MHHLGRHIQHYFPLFGILIATVLGFYLFPYDQSFQMTLIVAAALAYISWGIVHHYIHSDLRLSVFFEYIAIAFLGVIILYLLLF